MKHVHVADGSCDCYYEHLKTKKPITTRKAMIDELWRRKCEFDPVLAYCTTTRSLVLQKWTGRWEEKKPKMVNVTVPAGTILKIVMVSRLGDFGLTDDLRADHGYDIRIDWNDEAITDLRWEL